jgi:hypothetical protein
MTDPNRPYRTVRELVHAHIGRPAVVLGGGVSLPKEIGNCPGKDEAVYLSANQHGAMLIECDYIVAHDKIEEKIRPFGKPVVSRHMWADYRIMGSIVASTGVETAWVARLMGCAPIYIAGMDCFAGGGTYFHDPSADNIGFSLAVEEHLRRWQTTLTKYPAEYCPIGGPLQERMASWRCIREGTVDREQLLQEVGGVFVRFAGEMPHRGRTFSAGCRAELPYKEAMRLIELGHACVP